MRSPPCTGFCRHRRTGANRRIPRPPPGTGPGRIRSPNQGRQARHNPAAGKNLPADSRSRSQSRGTRKGTRERAAEGIGKGSEGSRTAEGSGAFQDPASRQARVGPAFRGFRQNTPSLSCGESSRSETAATTRTPPERSSLCGPSPGRRRVNDPRAWSGKAALCALPPVPTQGGRGTQAVRGSSPQPD